MNPFLHPTVALPHSTPPSAAGDSPSAAGAAQAAGAPAMRSFAPRSRARRRLSRALCFTGLLALGWAGAAAAVDVNTATLDQLRSVRGVGPKTAQIILEERQRAGRFRSFADLSDRVRGIGPRRAQALQAAGLRVGGGAPQGAEAGAVQASSPAVEKAMKPARIRPR